MAVALILNPVPEFIKIIGPSRFTRKKELIQSIILSRDNRPKAEQRQEQANKYLFHKNKLYPIWVNQSGSELVKGENLGINGGVVDNLWKSHVPLAHKVSQPGFQG